MFYVRRDLVSTQNNTMCPSSAQPIEAEWRMHTPVNEAIIGSYIGPSPVRTSSKTMLTHCRENHWQTISAQFESKYNNFTQENDSFISAKWRQFYLGFKVFESPSWAIPHANNRVPYTQFREGLSTQPLKRTTFPSEQQVIQLKDY